MGEKSYRKPFVATVEKVNHPSHYFNDDGEECIDVMIREFGKEAVIIWCRLNAFKYQFRKGRKQGESAEDDSAKETWYNNKEAELIME